MKRSDLSPGIADLITRIQAGAKDPATLDSRERKLIVKYFWEDGATGTSNRAIASIIGVSEQRVGHIKKWLTKNAVWQIDSLDVKTIAVDLLMRKKEVQRHAAARDDWGLVWKVETDFIKTLQELGFVYEAPKEILLDDKTKLGRMIETIFDRKGLIGVGEFISLAEGPDGTFGKGNGGGNGDRQLPPRTETEDDRVRDGKPEHS
jgi:hypothetical protein